MADRSHEEGNAGTPLAVSQVFEAFASAKIEVDEREDCHQREQSVL